MSRPVWAVIIVLTAAFFFALMREEETFGMKMWYLGGIVFCGIMMIILIGAVIAYGW